jgi:hypothetical protein
MRSGEEIRQALLAFAGRWRGYTGTERGEAQTFLNELFACYGRDRKDAGAGTGSWTRRSPPATAGRRR